MTAISVAGYSPWPDEIRKIYDVIINIKHIL